MRFLKGLIGLMLVAVMAVTGMGQTNTYSACTAKIGEYSTEISECDGWSASFITSNTNCLTLISEIEDLLAGPKFDPSYNPDGPAQKQAFQSMLDDLDGIRINRYNDWQSEDNSYSTTIASLADTPAGLTARANGTWANAWYMGVVWAAAQYQIIYDDATGHKAQVGLHTTDFETLSDAVIELYDDFATLKGLIDAY